MLVLTDLELRVPQSDDAQHPQDLFKLALGVTKTGLQNVVQRELAGMLLVESDRAEMQDCWERRQSAELEG